MSCKLFDQAERRGEEYGEHRAWYRGAIRLFQRGNDMDYVKDIFPDMPLEELRKAMEESKLPQ